MAQRSQIPFIGPQSVSRSVVVNNQATVNLMHAIKGPGAKAPVVLESAPGLVLLDSLVGNGPIRSPKMVSSKIRVAASQHELYGVYGSKLVAQTVDQGNVTVGTLNTSINPVSIARGRSYIMVVDGTDGYTYDGTTFAVIADLDFPSNPSHVVYIDGFFVVNDSETDNFYISASEDPTSWNALDFDAAAVAPDAALALAATESLLWILGDETAQPFYNSNNPAFPYDIVLSGVQEVGILAPHSIAESNDGIFYLATTPEGGKFVYQIQGTAGRTISGDEQEAFLDTVTSPEAATGFIYKQGGKSFYVLQFGATTGGDPRDSVTLIYNIKANAWETREINDGSAWRAGGHGILNNDNIVGSRLEASNYRLDLTDYQDAGEEMIRLRRTQVIHSTNHTITYWSVVVDVQGGIGNTDTPDPLLQLRYSDDAGRTWSSWLQASLGAIGETLTRCKFDKLGAARDRIFEIQCSGAVPLTIINAYAELTVEAD